MIGRQHSRIWPGDNKAAICSDHHTRLVLAVLAGTFHSLQEALRDASRPLDPWLVLPLRLVIRRAVLNPVACGSTVQMIVCVGQLAVTYACVAQQQARTWLTAAIANVAGRYRLLGS